MDGRIDLAREENNGNYICVIGSERRSSDLNSLFVAADGESVKPCLNCTYDTENAPDRFYYLRAICSFAVHNVPTILFFSRVHADHQKPSDASNTIVFSLMNKREMLLFLTGGAQPN